MLRLHIYVLLYYIHLWPAVKADPKVLSLNIFIYLHFTNSVDTIIVFY